MKVNQWHVYSFMKRTWLEKGRIPSSKEIISQFPYARVDDIQEGMAEFQLAYERELHELKPAKHRDEAHG